MLTRQQIRKVGRMMNQTDMTGVSEQPTGRNPSYDGSPEAEIKRLRNGRDRARLERDKATEECVRLRGLIRNVIEGKWSLTGLQEAIGDI